MLRSLVIRCAERALRPHGGDQRLLVLIYHRVLPQLDAMYPHDPDVATFARHMQTVAQDFDPVALGEAVELLAAGRLPSRALAVTFDDGFADNVTEALPVLRAAGIPATFFIASGYLGGGFMFNDAVIEACRQVPAGLWRTGIAELGEVTVGDAAGRAQLANQLIARLKYLDSARRLECAKSLLETARAAMPAGLMMTPQQVRELPLAGMEIGGHTRTHPILSRLDDAAAEAEIAGGRADLEAITGVPVRLFAYPNGRPGQDYGPREVGLVRKAGFRAAVSTAWGFADRATDVYQIPRVGSWGASTWKFSARLALTRARTRGPSCDPPMLGAGG